MKLYKTIYLLIVALTIFSIPVMAEENSDSFVLPEMPPTIERQKTPPMDKPVLQKQDFIQDVEIEPPFIWQNRGISGSDPKVSGIRLGISRGSFGSSGGELYFAAQNGSVFDLKALNSTGETPKLAREYNEFEYRWEKIGSGNIIGGISMKAGDNLIWTQKHRQYSGAGSITWYPRENLNFKLRAGGGSSEIVEAQANDNYGGEAEINLNPWQEHTACVRFSGQADSAFTKIKEFNETELTYGVLLAGSLNIKGGARLQKEDNYPVGAVIWNFLPRTTLAAEYRAGNEKPLWQGLYMRPYFVRPEAGLNIPKALSSVTETLSYFYREAFSVKVRMNQSSWNDYICWEQPAGSDYITPVNVQEVRITSTEAELALKNNLLGVKASAVLGRNASVNIPFLPENKLRFESELYLPLAFTLGAGCGIVSEQRVSLTGSAKLDSYTDIFASLTKEFPEGIIVYARGSNLSGNKHELQPGFMETLPVVECGITVQF